MMNPFIKTRVLSLAIGSGIALVGCSTLTEKVEKRSQEQTKKIVNEMNQGQITQVTRHKKPFMQVSSIPYHKHGDLVSISTLNAPLNEQVRLIADKYNYTISYLSQIPKVKVSAELKDLEPETAIRELALAAGLVAIKTSAKSFAIADLATVTFEVPTKQLNEITSQFSVEANPAQGSGSSGGSASSSNSSQVTPTGIKYKVEEKSNPRIESFQKYLESLGGEAGNTRVSIMPDVGLITVRGGGHAIKRIQDVLEHYMVRATSQVELSMAVVEIGLTRDFQFGIDWERVVPLDRALPGNSTGQALVSLNNASSVANPAISTLITTRNITSVINAVEQFTNVEVVSRPQLMLINNKANILRDVVQKPFVGNVTTTVTGQSGTSQNASAINFAQDGISLSVKANILDQSRIEITLVPLFAIANQLQQFPISKDLTLSAYVQPVKDGLLQIIAESGKTMIIAGTKVSNTNNQSRGVPRTAEIPLLNVLTNASNDEQNSRNLVIMVNAKILPAPRNNIVIAEAI